MKAADAHRSLDNSHRLDSILSHIEPRVVANDYTVRYGSRTWQIARADVKPGLRGARVSVEQRWDGTMAVRFGGRCLMVQACSAKSVTVKPLRPAPRPGLFRQGRRPGCAASSLRKRHPSGPSSKTKLATEQPSEGKRKAEQRRPGCRRAFFIQSLRSKLHQSNTCSFFRRKPHGQVVAHGASSITPPSFPLPANRTFLCGP